MSQFLARRWRQQPQGNVQVDWSNPLARGLIFAQVGNSPLDLVSGNIGTLNGSYQNVSSRNGVGMDLAATGYLTYPNVSQYMPQNNAVSMLTIARPNNGLANNTSGTYFGRSATTGAAWLIGFSISNYGSNYIDFRIRNEQGNYYGGSIHVGEYTVYNAPFVISTSGATGIPAKGYISGVLKATGGTLNNNFYSSGLLGIGIGTSTGSAAGANGRTFLNLAWNRVLSDAEHYEIGNNPWQIFVPLKFVSYSLPADLYTAIDEVISDRTDYIQSSSAGQVYQTSLQPVAQPGANTNIDFNFEADSPDDAGSLKFDLLSGQTVVKSQTVSLVRNWAGRLRSPQLRQQPQGTLQPNWSSPLARNLRHLFDGSQGRFLQVTREIEVQSSSAYIPQSILNGVVGRSFTTPDYSQILTTVSATSEPWTIAAVLTLSAMPSANVTLIGHTDQGRSTHDRTIQMNASGQFGVYTYDTNPRYVFGGPVATVGRLYKVIAWYDPIATTINIAVDNVNQTASAATPGVSGYQSYGTVYFSIGRSGGAGMQNFPSFSAALVLKSHTVWSQAERQMFFDSPWQIFRPPQAHAVSYVRPLDTTISVTPSDYSVIDTPQVGRFLPQRWRQQPVAPVRFSSPLMRPTAIWLPSSTGAIDTVGNAHAFTRSASNLSSVAVSSSGYVIRGADPSTTTGVSGYETVAGAINLVGKTAVTMFAVVTFHPSALNRTLETIILRTDRNDNINAYQLSLGIFPWSKTIRPLAADMAWTASTDTTLPNSFESGVPYLIVGHIKAGAAVTAGASKIGGKWSGLVTNNASFVAGSSIVANAVSQQTHIGGTAYSNVGWWGDVLLAGILPYSEPSDSIWQEVTTNPWQLFKPNPGHLYGLPPAGGWPWTPTLKVTSL